MSSLRLKTARVDLGLLERLQLLGQLRGERIDARLQLLKPRRDVIAERGLDSGGELTHLEVGAVQSLGDVPDLLRERRQSDAEIAVSEHRREDRGDRVQLLLQVRQLGRQALADGVAEVLEGGARLGQLGSEVVLNALPEVLGPGRHGVEALGDPFADGVLELQNIGLGRLERAPELPRDPIGRDLQLRVEEVDGLADGVERGQELVQSGERLHDGRGEREEAGPRRAGRNAYEREQLVADPGRQLEQLGERDRGDVDDAPQTGEGLAELLGGGVAENERAGHLLEEVRDRGKSLGGRAGEGLLEPADESADRLRDEVEQVTDRVEDRRPAPELHELGRDRRQRVEERVDRPGDGIADSGPQSLGLVEVADDLAPERRPAGAERLLDAADDLREGLVLSGGRLGHRRVLLNIGDLLVGVAHRTELLVREVTRELGQRLDHDLRREPAFLEGLAEGPVLLDQRVDVRAVGGRRALQGLLEGLAAHGGVLDRHPVLKADRARGERLRQLLHGVSGLLTVRAHDGGEVRHALDGRDRVLQSDAGRREATDVGGHLTEVVDRVVGVLVQLVGGCRDGLEILALCGGVRQNRLSGVELKLVLLEAVDDRVEGEALDRRSGLSDDVRRQVADGDRGGVGHDAELRPDVLGGDAEGLQVDALDRLADPAQAVRRDVLVQAGVQLAKSVQRGFDAAQELLGLELERDHPLFDFSHWSPSSKRRPRSRP